MLKNWHKWGDIEGWGMDEVERVEVREMPINRAVWEIGERLLRNYQCSAQKTLITI